MQSQPALKALDKITPHMKQQLSETSKNDSDVGVGEPQTRYQQGIKQLNALNSDLCLQLTENLKEVAPDLLHYITEFIYGEVYARPGLDLKTRQMITVAALTVLGHPQPLKIHITNAFNAGCSLQEIEEIMIQMAMYAGFPAALNAMLVAKEVFEERSM